MGRPDRLSPLPAVLAECEDRLAGPAVSHHPRHYSPALVIEIPLEGIPRVFAVANTEADERRLRVDLGRRLGRLPLDEMVMHWLGKTRRVG